MNRLFKRCGISSGGRSGKSKEGWVMRNLFRLGVIGILAIAQPLFAQTYPVKPVRIVVPFAPGASTDAVARLIALELGAVLGSSFVVENRAGAGGTVGAAVVAKAEPDGYTLLAITASHVLAMRAMKSVPYHPINDFTPISALSFMPLVIAGARQQPFTSLKEMAQYAKANPEKLTIGNSEFSTRLAAEMLSQAGNIKLTHVGYKGGGPIIIDVLGGHLALGISTPSGVGTFYKEKERRLTVLAVTSQKRFAGMPDIPTVAEALGIADFDFQIWVALLGPANMPPPIVDRLQRAIARIVVKPDFLVRLQAIGMEPAEDTTPQGLATLMKTFEQRKGALSDAAGIKPE